MSFSLEYPAGPAVEERALYAHPSPHPLYAPNCPKLPAVFSNLSNKTKYQILLLRTTFNFIYTSSLIYFTSQVKLGEIRIGRIKWLLQKCTAEKRSRPPLTGNIKYRLSVMASLQRRQLLISMLHVILGLIKMFCDFQFLYAQRKFFFLAELITKRILEFLLYSFFRSCEGLEEQNSQRKF